MFQRMQIKRTVITKRENSKSNTIQYKKKHYNLEKHYYFAFN